jgi:hypothetical protein
MFVKRMAVQERFDSDTWYKIYVNIFMHYFIVLMIMIVYIMLMFHNLITHVYEIEDIEWL